MGTTSSTPTTSAESSLKQECSLSPYLQPEKCRDICEQDPVKPCDNNIKGICVWGDNYNRNPYCKTVCQRYPEYCKKVMSDADYCSSGVDQLNTERCQSYCFDNEAKCNEYKKLYCSNSVNTDTCRDFCFNNPGQCDDTMIQYCTQNPTDILCSCITSIADNPVCYDKKCFLGGYKTSEHVQKKVNDANCDKLDCNSYYKLRNSDNIDFKDDTNIADKCLKQCSTNKQGCDEFITYYCQEESNSKSKECSCVNSDYTKLDYNPVCHEPTCKQYGYTGNLIKKNPCPETITCNDKLKQYPDIYDTYCNNASLKHDIPDTSSSPLTSPSSVVTPDSDNTNFPWLYVGIGIGVVVIILGIGGFILYKIMKT